MLPRCWVCSPFNSSQSHLCETLQPLAAVTSLNCQPQMTDTSSILPELHLQASLGRIGQVHQAWGHFPTRARLPQNESSSYLLPLAQANSLGASRPKGVNGPLIIPCKFFMRTSAHAPLPLSTPLYLSLSLPTSSLSLFSLLSCLTLSSPFRE